ncbi:unnamed protein product, partial [Prorocentrum cordatum]
ERAGTSDHGQPRGGRPAVVQGAGLLADPHVPKPGVERGADCLQAGEGRGEPLECDPDRHRVEAVARVPAEAARDHEHGNIERAVEVPR